MSKSLKISSVYITFIILILAVAVAAQPLVTTVTPVQNELNVAPSSSITISFNETMDSTSINDTTVVVNGSLSVLSSGTFSFDSSNTSVTYIPDESFAEGERVTVVLTTAITNSISAPLSQSFVWSFTTSVSLGTGYFSLDSVYAIDTLPHSIFTADFNNDGFFDLATSNFEFGRVSVLLNNGIGQFGAQALYNVGTETRYVYGADFDNDGYVDLAAGNGGTDNVSVLINNGDGTFASAVDYGAGDGPHSICAADFNGDGYNDIACGNAFENTVSILINDGDGTFATDVIYGAGAHPRSVFAADFDNDADIDIATANLDESTTSVLLNNGDGTFSSSIEYGTGARPRLVHSQDVNSDGNMDLLTANSLAGNISVLLGNGDGTFDTTVNYSVSAASPYAVNASDFIVGGELDLLSANLGNDNLSVFENLGGGTFALVNQFLSGGDGPLSLAVADFNGDGGLDVAVSNYFGNSISVLFNDSALTITDDSLVIPSISVFPCVTTCTAEQPVQTRLSQPIVGASIPIEVPDGVSICSLSVQGLITEDWDFSVLDYEFSDSTGYAFVVLANSLGEVIPPGTNTIFNIYFRAASMCQQSYFIHWDTALADDPSRQLKFADTAFQLIFPKFDSGVDSTEILGYVAGDFDANGTVNIIDANAFVNRIFRGAGLPCQPNAADMNGDCHGPDIADLSYMINYLFRMGAGPKCGCIGL